MTRRNGSEDSAADVPIQVHRGPRFPGQLCATGLGLRSGRWGTKDTKVKEVLVSGSRKRTQFVKVD